MKLRYIRDTLMLINETDPFLLAGVVLKGGDSWVSYHLLWTTSYHVVASQVI